MIEDSRPEEMEIVGTSRQLREVVRVAKEKIAPSDASVIITGETGTGKELIARMIHFESLRSKHPLVVVNCGAIPQGLEDSYLFGHIKGAFTGAIENKKGAFERANKGTIFLDEIGELPLNTQGKLLRVLQEKEVCPIGGVNLSKVDFRFVCATHRNLPEMVKEKKFREDLFYRINVIQVELPALRKRKDDIIPLVEYFFKKHIQPGQKFPEIDSDLEVVLRLHDWPGNIRELENVSRKFLVLGACKDVFLERLPEKEKILILAEIVEMRKCLEEQLAEIESKKNDLDNKLFEVKIKKEEIEKNKARVLKRERELNALARIILGESSSENDGISRRQEIRKGE